MESNPIPNVNCQKVCNHMKGKLYQTQYTWIIDNFSFRCEQNGTSIDSPIFFLNFGHNRARFGLKVYPRGHNQNNLNTSIYLQMVDKIKLYCKYKLDIYRDEKYISYNFSSVFFKENKIVGASLCNSINSFPDDKFHVRCTISTVVYQRVIIRNEVLTTKKSVIEDLEIFFKTKEFSVFILIVDGETILVHKLILSARNSIFKKLISESKVSSLEVKDVSYDVLNEFLRYIYTGKLSNIKYSKELYVASVLFEEKELGEACFQYVIQNLTVDNFGENFIFFQKKSLTKLKTKLLEFFQKNGKEIMKTESYMSLKKEHPQVLINEIFEIIEFLSILILFFL